MIFVSNVDSDIIILQSVLRSPFAGIFLAVGEVCSMC